MTNFTFDPEAFLDLPIDTEFKKRPPLPIGDYTAMISEVKPRQWQGKQDPTKSGLAYDVTLVVEVPGAIVEQLGLAQPTLMLKDSIMLDLTPEGGIDGAPGRNRSLRNYREALDMNKAGEVFRAREMIGKPLRVKVTHELYQNEPVERVSGVSRL
jgi:hypothetical protein